MTISDALSSMLTQTCDIYLRSTTTGSDLGDIKRGYSATPDTSDAACLVRPFGKGARHEGLQRDVYGDYSDESLMLVISDAVEINKDAKVVLKTWEDGTSLSADEQSDHTYVVNIVYSGRVNTGHQQAVISPLRKR